MPKENASPDATLDAIKKVDIVSELLEDKNNLKMIAEGITSWGDAVLGQSRSCKDLRLGGFDALLCANL
jgi:hypothetical protein